MPFSKTEQDFTTHKGEHKRLNFEITDTTKDDLSFLNVDLVISELGDLTNPILEKSTDSGDFSFDTDEPVFYKNLDPSDYTDITKNFYEYQIVVEDSDGNTSVTHGGYIWVRPSKDGDVDSIFQNMYGDPNIIKNRTGTTAEALGLTEVRYELMLRNLLHKASRRLERYCGIPFYEITGFTERKRGEGRRRITLKNYPVTNIQEVKTGDSVLDPKYYEIVDEGEIYQNVGTLRRIDGRWTSRDIKITYDYGFQKTPPEVSGVAEEIVLRLVNEANAEVKASGANSISMDGYSVDFGTVNAEDKLRLTEAQRERLDNFKEPMVV